MRLGILSDAHGNPAALRPCLDRLAAEGAEQLLFLGDVVGYLPDAGEALEALRAAGARFLLGNHEAMLLGRLPLDPRREEVYRLARARLSAEQRAFLGTLEPRREVTLGGRRLLLLHGSPTDPLAGYVYPTTPLDGFAALGVDAVFMGHTHHPFVRRAGDVQVVNVGSCGLPRDHGDRASCAVYDTADGRCELLRVPFAADDVIARYGDELHPDVIACLRRRGRSFPGESA